MVERIEEKVKEKYEEQDDGSYECEECGSMIMQGTKQVPVHDGPTPFSGSGNVSTINVPFCPNCEDPPS
jgi:hypothetical protein